jgi:septal ring factor EnvC (AmiA/AmiB activator)
MAKKTQNKSPIIKDIEKLLSQQTGVILGAVDSKFQRVDNRFAGLEARMDSFEKRMNNLEKSMDELRNTLDKFLKKLADFNDEFKIVRSSA